MLSNLYNNYNIVICTVNTIILLKRLKFVSNTSEKKYSLKHKAPMNVIRSIITTDQNEHPTSTVGLATHT